MISKKGNILNRSRGFTLIEILASVFVVSILSPLLAVVFYQVMVIPPEQSARLTLVNEVGFMASYLSNDVHMSGNYSAGTYPYFGNFSWTDNSSNTRYLVSYYFNSSQQAIIRNLRTYYPASNVSVNQSTVITLSHYISSANFSLIERPDNIEAIITANATTRMGKQISHTLTLYIAPRPVFAGLGRGGIWGEDPVIGTNSLVISGPQNMINGDINVDGVITVTANDNKVTGVLLCDSLNKGSTNFEYGSLVTPCTSCTNIPSIGTPQDYFGTNLSAGLQVLDDIHHEYVFNTSVSLTSINQVWKNNNPSTHELKPGYYYSPGTITLKDHSTRGAVTFIANKIVITNDTTSQWDENRYIGIEYFNDKGLLLWATGNSGNDIYINGSSGTWNPCAKIEGVLYAPNGEVELAGTGSTLPDYAKAMLTRGAIMAKDFTVSGQDWWIFRW
jgi:prepilin-type N-terminal cleavage/methylation domain-containing protein